MSVSYPLLDPKINTDYPTRYCFHKLILQKFRNVDKDGIMKAVEVGLGFGDYSVYLLESLISVRFNDFHLTSIDNWSGRMMRKQMKDEAEKTLSRFAKYDTKNFNFMDVPSVDAANKFEDESLDFVYLDANHKGKEVLKDLRAWWQKVKDGGIFSGHDYCAYRRDGVRRAVYTFFTEDVKKSGDIWITRDVNPNASWGIFK